jgi:hypothetical protein
MPGRLRLSGAQLTVDQNVNIGTFGQFAEIASPVTPNTGFLRLYGKSDHKLYLKDTSGAESPLLTQILADARYDVLGAATTGDASHVANVDPHPQYLTTAEGDARYAIVSGGPGGIYLTDGMADTMYVRQDGTKTMTGGLRFQPDNTVDIGASGANRPRTVYAGTSVVANSGSSLTTIGQTSASGAYFVGSNFGSMIFGSGSTPYFSMSGSNFLPSTDNTKDIGTSSQRIRDLYLARDLVASPTGSINFLPTAVGSYGAGVWASMNAYWDGTNFQAYNIANPTTYLNLSSSGASIAYAPAHANPVTGFQWLWSLNTAGLMQIYSGIAPSIVTSGGIWLDSGGTWDGPVSGMTTPALYFGGGPTATGEGIGSKRTAGGNQYGLEFFVGWISRMSLSTSTLSVNVNANFISTQANGIATAGGSVQTLMVQAGGGSSGGGGAFMAFHRPGSYAAYFGLDTDNVFRVGGWSMGAAAYRLILGDGYTSNGAITVGQVNASYFVCEGGDIGAGPLYFRHNGSYYIQFDNVNMFQAVNMNVMSWGSYYFSANAGIFIGSWDGTWIHTSHSIMMNGANIGFSNNGGVYWGYDGTWMRAYGVTGIGTSGSYLWMANNSAVGLYWDGTWVNIQPRAWAVNEMSCDVGIIRNQSSGLRFIDDNVRIFRPASTNQMKIYVYDAWCQWHRAWDGTSMGYVDLAGFHNPSTLKNKSNIKTLRDGMSLIADERVRPVRYTINDRRQKQIFARPSVGFIAEEMVEVVPEVVGLDPDTNEPVGINYGALVPILWDAVRTLNARVEELEEKLNV